MKNRKTILTFIVLASFIIPSVTFAYWYDPFSWSIWSIFKRDVAPVVVQPVSFPVSTSTPTVSSSTEPKINVVPVVQKKVVATPKPPQIKAVTTVSETNPTVDNSEIVAALEKIKKNASNISISRNDKILELKTWNTNITGGQYSDEYSVPREMISKLVSIYSEEASFAQLLSSSIDKTISENKDMESRYTEIHDAYLDLYSMAMNTNTISPSLLKLIDDVIGQCREVEIMRVKLDTTREVLAENGVNVSNTKTSTEIEQQRSQLNNDADTFIKNLSDAQAKLTSSDKEQREKYLKAIIYSPIGGSGWLNSR